MCSCLSQAPYWGPGLQPRHMPWLEIEPATLWFSGQCSIHSATPARASVLYFLYLQYQVSIGVKQAYNISRGYNSQKQGKTILCSIEILFYLFIVRVQLSLFSFQYFPPSHPPPPPTFNPFPLWLCPWALHTCSLTTLPLLSPIVPSPVPSGFCQFALLSTFQALLPGT